MPSARDVLLLPPTRSDQDEVEQRFFSAICLGNGTPKITSARRLDDLNSLIQEHLPDRRPVRAMDVGISSGVSTLEWFASLRSAGVDCQMVAGDLSAHALLWNVGSIVRVLTEETGHPLQYEIGGLAISNAPHRLRQLVLAIPNRLSRAFLRRSARTETHSNGAAASVTSQRVALVSPRLTVETEIEIIDDDVFQDWMSPRRFDVVRVANVLNPTHFDPDLISKGIISLHQRLATGGLLVICRSDGAADRMGNWASVLRRQRDGSLTVEARLRGGSELESSALAAGQRVAKELRSVSRETPA